jgi:hypothetical protein
MMIREAFVWNAPPRQLANMPLRAKFFAQSRVRA